MGDSTTSRTAGHPWGLPTLRPSTMATPDQLAAMRSAMIAPLPNSDTVTVVEVPIGGVTCVTCTPVEPVATLVYLHGGGFRLGSARRSAEFGVRVAAAAGARVVVVEYALAPEAPFPAALAEIAAVYDDVDQRFDGALLVGGDSAGGGLAASLVLAGLLAHRPPADGVLLLSPWIDLTVTAATYESRSGSDTLFSRASATAASELYLQGWDPTDPLVSPVFGELGGFPPTLVFAGGDEVLLDDALGFAAALARAGATVETHVVAGMQHVWPTLFPDLPETGAAIGTIARFVAERAAARPKTLPGTTSTKEAHP